MTYGTIPDEIVIVSSVEQPVYRCWDDAPPDGSDISLKREKEMVIPAFVCKAGNSKTIVTAVTWAERHRNYYDADLKTQVKKSDPVVQEHRKNEPMKDLRVVALDVRNNGGRAYKIMTKDKYYFDMREDVLLDAMIKAGIREGGILNGEYIWANVSSQMKIVRVGSALHMSLIKDTEKSKLKRIGIKELVHGGVYATKRGEKYVYLGRVNATDFEYRTNYSSSYRYASPYPTTPQPQYTITRRDLKNVLAYISTSSHDKSKSVEEVFLENKTRTYCTHISPTHTFVEHVDTLDLDWKKEIEEIKNLSLNEAKTSYNTGVDNKHYLCRCSLRATMTPSEAPFQLDSAYDDIVKVATPKLPKTKAA